MQSGLCTARLQAENRRFAGSGGRSEENRGAGFRPAFRDHASGVVWLSRFHDGRPAPCHLLDGLPDEAVSQRAADGRPRALKSSVESGFVRNGVFFTRDQAAAWFSAH
ncbi:MAG: hypothetical protein KDH17_15195 [Rhodocyclaceae bacterium]|nr:hypothetical protein [Rhodocyclaceae bacterium]